MSDQRAIADTLTREGKANADDFLAAPFLSTLKQRLQEIEPHDSEAVLEAIRPLAQNLDWLTGRIENWLSQIGADSNFLPPVFAVQGHGLDFRDTGMTLFMHPLLTISVNSLFPRARRVEDRNDVVFSARPGMIRFAGSGSGVLQWWRCTRLDDKTDMTRAVTVEPGEEHIVDGSTPPIEYDGAETTFEIREITGSLTILSFILRDSACPISVRYNPSRRAVVSVAPNKAVDARMLISAMALRNLEREDRIEALKTQLTHPSFFVRWQLMREYIAARGTSTIPDLEAFIAREENPSVKRAALATLQMLQKRASEAPHAD